MILPFAELGEHWATLKISPWGWDKALQSLILNGALLERPALEIWISTGMSSQVFCQISQRMWNAAYDIFMFLYLLWEGRSLVIQQKACQYVPKSFEQIRDDKVSLYSHGWQGEGEVFSVTWLQHFWSSTSYLKDEFATSFRCSLSLSGFANMMFSRWIQALSVWALCGSNGIQL